MTITKEAVTAKATWLLFSINGKEIGWIDQRGVTIFDPVTSSIDVNYETVLNQTTRNDGIYHKGPFSTNVDSLTRNESGKSYNGKRVTITKEAVTVKATWLLFSMNGKEIGWMDQRGVTIFDPVTSSIDVNYETVLNQTTRNDGIYHKGPFSTNVDSLIRNESGKSYDGKRVTITKEAVTVKATWLLFSINGKEIGWIDQRGVTIFDPVTSSKDVNYETVLNQTTRNDGIYHKGPFSTNVDSLTRNESGKSYDGKRVTITKEAVTVKATWLLFSMNGKEIGWIDKKAVFVFDEILSQTDVSYSSTLNQYYRNDGIYFYGPFHTNENTISRNDSGEKYHGKKVVVTKEAVTAKATWAQFSIDGVVIGWIDKKALTSFDIVLSEKKVNYTDYLNQVNRNDGIYFYGPFSTSENTQIRNDSGKNYDLKKVVVSKEVETVKATWVYYSINGKATGWIDKRALLNANGSILNVPVIGQRPVLPTGCEIKAVTMMLNFTGKNLSITSLAHEMPKHSSNPNIGYVGDPFTPRG